MQPALQAQVLDESGIKPLESRLVECPAIKLVASTVVGQLLSGGKDHIAVANLFENRRRLIVLN